MFGLLLPMATVCCLASLSTVLGKTENSNNDCSYIVRRWGVVCVKKGITSGNHYSLNLHSNYSNKITLQLMQRNFARLFILYIFSIGNHEKIGQQIKIMRIRLHNLRKRTKRGVTLERQYTTALKTLRNTQSLLTKSLQVLKQKQKIFR